MHNYLYCGHYKYIFHAYDLHCWVLRALLEVTDALLGHISSNMSSSGLQMFSTFIFELLIDISI